MNLRSLRYFSMVAEAKNLTAAATYLHVAQPALSKAVRAIEDELEVTLLQRSHHGVSLTVAGARFYEHCKIILEQVDRACASARASSGQKTIRVAIGMPYSVMMVLGVPLLLKAGKESPELQIELVQEHSHLLGGSLRSGYLDLAVMAAQPSDVGLAQHPLLAEELFFVERRSHNRTASRPIPFEEASLRTFVLPGVRNGLRRAVEEYFRARALPLTVTQEVGGIALIPHCVGKGLGASVLPGGCLGRNPLAGQLDVRPFMGGCTRTIVLSQAAATPTPTITLARRIVRDTVKELMESRKWVGGNAAMSGPR